MKTLPDGIYLDLSFEDYLAEPRVSSSSLTKLMESPSAFWADSWMNPDREESEETSAMTLGRAYHCARLEPEKFERLFCRQLVPEDFEGAELLTNGTQIGSKLGDLGLTKKGSGESVADQAARLADVLPKGSPIKIWPIELAKWERDELRDRTPIQPKAWDEIRRDAERVRMNPEIASLLEGGLAEVSILFTDPETGVKCKIRPDYLGPDWITHLKTWDMKTAGKPGNRAIADAFRFNGYYRAAWFYHLGLEQIKAAELPLRLEGGKICKLTEIDKPTASIVAAWQAGGSFETWYLFVRRAGIPDVRARLVEWFRLPPGVDEQSIGTSVEKFQRTASAIARKADLETRACLRSVVENSEIYGGDGSPWFPRDLIGTLEDDDFNDFWLDSVDDPR